MHSIVASRLGKAFWNTLALGLLLALLSGICASGFAQNASASRPPAGRSATGWSSLPPEAQRAIRSALEKDDSGWAQQAELTASDGKMNDEFGYSVAVDATAGTAVVGAPRHTVGSNLYQGAAYVFVQSGASWTQQAELIASDGGWEDNFGWSVAVSGSTVVVAAPWHTVGSNTDQGAAYVFVQSDGTWSQQAELTASDGVAYDLFGYSVALNGSTAVVGSYEHNNQQGAAYVFAQSGTTWSQQAELTASDGAAYDDFGFSVAVSGTTAVAGAYGHNTNAGAAYVFDGSSGTWIQQQELSASDGAQYDDFGWSVAVDANAGTAVVGARNHTVGSNTQQGAAYVFSESSGTWSQQQELTASDGAQDDYFGWAVAVNGGTVIVGSYGGTGAAYVFAASGATWSQQAELTPPDGGCFCYVAVSGSTAVLGDAYQTVGSNGSQGAAYVFGPPLPSFTLSASPGTLSLLQGQQGTSTITITAANGFSASVSLSASGLPSGVTAAFNPNPATSTSTLTLAASATATAGTATVTVTGTSGSLTATTTLTLTVLAATTVTLSPASLNFGKEAVNNTTAAKTVTLKNTGTATLNISSIGFALGTNFAISTISCQATLAVNKTCKVSVTFTPTELGALPDTLSFTDNASGSPQTVPLSGTGVAQAALTPASYAFPKTKVGDTSAAHKFTLKNNLPTTLTGISYSIAAPFAVSTTTCGTTLDSKGSCTISVTFSPTATGTAAGTLTVNDSANDSPQTASLSGTGD